MTFDEVKIAVETLTRDGVSISAGAIRTELGNRGSKTTILKHLTALREQQPPAAHAGTRGLSDHLLQMLAAEVVKVAGERTAQLESGLVEARGAVDDLVEDNEKLREEVVHSEGVIESLKRSLAEQSGAEVELRAQILGLAEQLALSKHDAESARQKTSLADERLSSREDRFIRADALLSAANQEVKELRMRVESLGADTAAARSDARALSVELAAKQDLEAALRESRAQCAELQGHLDEAHKRLSAVEAHRGALDGRLAEAKAALERSETSVQELLARLLPGSIPAQGATAQRNR